MDPDPPSSLDAKDPATQAGPAAGRRGSDAAPEGQGPGATSPRSFAAQHFGILRHRARGPSATVATAGWLRWVALVALAQAACSLAAQLLEAYQAGGGDAGAVAAPALLGVAILALVALVVGRYLTWAVDGWLERAPHGVRHTFVAGVVAILVGAVSFAVGVVALADPSLAGARLGLLASATLLGLVLAHGGLMVILNRNKARASRGWT